MNQIYKQVSYVPDSGQFYRHFKKGIKHIPGARNSDGYLSIKYEGKTISCHVLAFKLMGIDIPSGFEVDHLDRIKDNNKWKNLALKTHADNMINLEQRRDLPLGVCLLPSGNYRVRFRGEHICTVATLEEARELSQGLRHDKTTADI